MAAGRSRKTRKSTTDRSAQSAPTTRAAAEPSVQLGAGACFPIVGVGASAGGLEAFTQLLAALPLDNGAGLVLVQHLDPNHESALTQILSRATSLPVHEITDGQRVEPNHVYVIPRDMNLSIAGGVLKIDRRERMRSLHRPIDSFFASLAQDQGERAVGVVLSGTASDGTRGLEAIKAEGGITLAQDDSAKYDSMPRSAVAAGCVDFVLPPAHIAQELVRIAKHPYVAGQAVFPSTQDDPRSATTQRDGQTPSRSPRQAAPPEAELMHVEVESGREQGGEPNAAKATQNGYDRILLLLRNHSGVDFSLYKSSTIRRRIARRLVLNRLNTLQDYASFLRGNAAELGALYSDVLISVTSFFRDPEMFKVLERKVLPELLKQRGNDVLRCWVLGCSTGQEAYSIAMVLTEAAEKAPRMRKLQVFATDLNETLLEKARQGLYAKNLAGDIAEERLRRFFVEEEGGYRVSKALREMVVFARQNLIADPPFSRMDLISCRNLLIYLEPSLQKQAMPTFHYALKPGGFLLLGASESTGGFAHLFEPVDKKHKIYSKKPAPVSALHVPMWNENSDRRSGSPPSPPTQQPRGPHVPQAPHLELNAQREADRITLNQVAPPGVLVNAGLQVLQFRGSTGAFLEPAIGAASFDVLKMAREGLMLPLRSALLQARKDNTTARRQNVRVKTNGETLTLNLEVIPLKNLRERCFLILFWQTEKARGVQESTAPQPVRAGRPADGEEASRIAELETDRSEAREYLQSIQEQHEVANEELQAANEEVQSANEELQSINEELETSKEELESTNEELTTVNDEMSNRNNELKRLNNDLVNLQSSAKLAVVLLGRDLIIRRFSPQAEKQFELLAGDVGRPISHIRHDLVIGDATQAALDLEGLSAEVISSVREQEREVRDKDGRWHSLRVRPYITLDAKVDGAVIVLFDIDTLKRSEQAMRESEARYRAMFESTSVGVSESDAASGAFLRVNDQFARMLGYGPAELVGKTFLELIHADDRPGNGEGDFRVIRGEIAFQESEKRLVRKNGAVVWVHVTVNLVRDAHGRPLRTMAIALDITERKRLEHELRQHGSDLMQADLRKNEFLAMLGHELRNPLSALAHGLDLLGKVPDDAARAEELRGMMVRQTSRIGALIDQLLDIARVISGKVELSKGRLDLAEVVRAAVETVKPLLDAQKHKLALSLPPANSALVLGDAVRLTQVVENLLTNAAKYTSEGGQIALAVDSDEKEVRIIVADTGIGMSAGFVPHVFEVFTQAPQTLDRAKGGLGLGLPLVQRLVEMHEGRVRAESSGLGQGSEFIVTLPRLFERRASDSPAAGPAAPGADRPRRILVVDDEEIVAELFAELLEGDGHQALAVYDGPSALEAVGSFGPDVVLLDLGLPGMDGYEVARRIREQHGDRKMLLIAVTGYQNDGARLEQAGFDQHLIKPPSMQKLSALLAAWNPNEARPSKTIVSGPPDPSQ